ncbi:hypothetical protein AB833_17035 [Chromatiales bacterium (ex Bugula neritina AB1)]|nr:hypothetical protein AB833_17035 [Chromatiales bacterium (ex Bugula neritina AB1)]
MIVKVYICLFLTGITVISPVKAIDLPDFKGLVAANGKAVVKVTVSARSESPAGSNRLPNFNEDEMPEFLRRFFEEMPDLPQAPRGNESAGFGSGFVLSEDGYIVTNAHVVRNAESIQVGLPDRREFDAELIGADDRTDVAVLKVEATGLPTLTLGNSDKLKVGQWVLAIGSPFGFEYTATQGIASALTRSLPNENYVPFIQTDVAVNPGNSGGPLFDLDGNVIGVNSQIYSRSGGYMGLSFAIPINLVQSVVRQLKTKGYVSRGWLGVVIQDVDQALADSFGLDKPAGALVAQVTEGSPAAEAGIQAGDVILEFNGNELANSSALPPMVGNTEVGQTADIEVLRKRTSMTLQVTIKELDEGRPAGTTGEKESNENLLGMTVTPMSLEKLKELGLTNGVKVASVDSGGIASSAGISSGDVIISFNQSDVTSVSQLAALIKSAGSGQSVAVLVSRNKNPLFLALAMP